MGRGYGMILSMIKIFPATAKQQEILDILLSVRGPTLATSGCLECSIYEEHDDEHAIVYLEKWQSRKVMVNHVRSLLYPRVLKALELSARHPEIVFYELAGAEGIELIVRERSSVV